MNLLTKFHEDQTVNVASRPFCLSKYIIGTNLLTKFHEDWKISVASRVLTRKNAPPPGGHAFQPICIIFELAQDINGMNLLTKKNAQPLGSHVFQAKTILLTKFHEDWTINVASRELTRQILTSHDRQRTMHDGQRAITKAYHEHHVLR
ncbi:hypothetical protein DPMN_114839 [Dreissena polymorpha]|uniref:Uncharacterized protein n=1 Tax=Dreissena polymorpha TaxID=45954 RepID=A0A9D4QT82_DREPO|nr:hypothetical protein DPMN_114839 [Dreissena polymorpha]